MIHSTSIFSFATIRNASDKKKIDLNKSVMPSTDLSKKIVQIIETNKLRDEKIKALNTFLKNYVEGSKFFKTEHELSKQVVSDPNIKDKKTTDLVEQLYDNIVVNVLIGNTQSLVYKLIIEELQTIFQKLNEETIKDPKTVNIILPKGLLLNLGKSNLTESINKKETVISKKTTATESEERLISKPRTFIKASHGKWYDAELMGNYIDINQQTGNNIMIYNDGCHTKIPFQIADLRVVEIETIGYLPKEIAHVNNVQGNEKHTKTTRRLKRIETFDSFISENEITKETDTQSTEKFSIEREAAQVKEEESSINVNASVSASYGVAKASLDAGFQNTQSEQTANATSQTYAKEVVQKVIDRVSNKIRSERSLKTIEEFEENVEHIIDNTNSSEPKSYVYRWLSKIVKGTLKNYGKRLIFQIDIAHPSHYYLYRTMNSPVEKANYPLDPRIAKIRDNEITEKDGIKLFDYLNRNNYQEFADIYQVTLPFPKDKELLIGKSFCGKDGLIEKDIMDIEKGYCAIEVKAVDLRDDWNADSQVGYFIGVEGQFNGPGEHHMWGGARAFGLNRSTKNIAISVFFKGPHYSILNLEIKLELTDEGELAWKQECYKLLIEGYNTLKEAADIKMNSWSINDIDMNPTKKRELIASELKRDALKKILDCNIAGLNFTVNDEYIIGEEYNQSCCVDAINAEKVRFIENCFDFKNMTYELFPYFYGNKNNWDAQLKLNDEDPHFEAFLKASYASIQIPVHRDTMKERAAINFILNNSIANYAAIPANAQNLIAELENEPASPFDYEINANPSIPPKPITTVDIGMFEVPTDLVILECGTERGIKPREDHALSTAILDQFKSPAIIADPCVH
ncbi:hypothetical protein [Flavobacterium chungangense]|uniref:Uncharacterized protein n=1 Tax=Flavobacterium chungangense TaxID=554283 RepID=A0A6V6ZEG9_9FLAO|nr:hypothetical protein [Flavobacterium chungangense]CAD0009824.1 hypothetical protein FLACHUCJ7_04464 [Flavobacterium chungangense]